MKSILRGTFRLSVVVALVALLSFAVYAHFTGLDAVQQDWEIWQTLRCGQTFLNKDMSEYTNQYGLIDIGTAGCSQSRFLATFDEIRNALASDHPRDRYSQVFWPKLYDALAYALVAFVVVNLLGLLFLAARGALRWVWAGYR
jgi:hypothetical protein